MRHVRVVVGATTLAAVGLTLVAPAPAGAGGGDWMDPDRDRYEPGQQATLVGYTEAAAALRATEAGPVSDADWRTPGPYHAYLRVDPAAVENDDTPWSFVHPTDLRVGQVLVEEKTEPYLRLRVGVTFRLPEHLAPAMYTVMVCNDPCTTTLGYLMDSAVYVGMNPEGPVVRNWPLDEPLIRYLDDGALLADPAGQGDDLDDWTVTAAEVRAGYRPSPTATPAPAPAPPAPEPDGAPPSTTPPTKVRAPVDESPAVRAGADPPGGLPSEVIAWLVGLGVLIVVWCLAWRWRPQERRLVVRQADGHRPADAPDAADDEPEPVHVQL